MNTAFEVGVEQLCWARPTNRLLLFEGRFGPRDGANLNWSVFTRGMEDTKIPTLRVRELQVSLHRMLGHLDQTNGT